MKKAVIGILAHVDSGKTTLAEAMLYLTGAIRKLGRVDYRNCFFDTEKIERDRGITVFSKQAQFSIDDIQFTMLDTPGHIDFSAEMERTLQVLDMAVLVISGVDGVQSHTETLWRLLKKYNIPVFIFVNKMDITGVRKDFILSDMTAHLSVDCIDFSCMNDEFYEKISSCSEDMMEMYLEKGVPDDKLISDAVAKRLVFPCFFGSALKIEGVQEFIDALGRYAVCPPDKSEFAAKVFKIGDDGCGNRLTYMKITGGKLNVRDLIEYTDKSGENFSEKISRIRIYNGEKFSNAECAEQGTVCAVMGLGSAYAGQGLGCEADNNIIMLEPVLAYKITSDDTDVHTLLQYLRILEDEDPMLNVSVNRNTGEVYLKLMGEIQKEVISQVISERFGISVTFGQASISYKETIADSIEGVGHYEPLRHYAEVHLMLSPLPQGSGLVFDTDCSEDILDRNWQRLILTHLMEKVHKGVLTCSPITDMKITLINGKAHLKHTEGGDFRQATYRAVRNGLRRAESILLEPWYEFRLEIPSECTGRALNDISNMCGRFGTPDIIGDNTVICGYAPVSEMRSYHTDVAGYTGGRGRLSCTLNGYEKCHNADEIINQLGYNCDNDTDNTADSVFCSHGAGFVVKWNEVENYMHIPYADSRNNTYEDNDGLQTKTTDYCRRAADDKELMEIFERTYGKINRDRRYLMHTPKPVEVKDYKPSKRSKKKKYLLVDGYNIIFAWDNLKKLAQKSLDLARSELINILSNYQSFSRCEIIIVFDAYKVKESAGSVTRLYNVSIVYTKEAETADTYIERVSHELSGDNNVCVATSDGTEQLIIMGNGAYRISAADLYAEVKMAEKAVREYIDNMR